MLLFYFSETSKDENLPGTTVLTTTITQPHLDDVIKSLGLPGRLATTTRRRCCETINLVVFVLCYSYNKKPIILLIC